MIYYLKLIGLIIGCTVAGMLAAAITGYLLGAIFGLSLTFYNNTLPDAPNGAYLPMVYLLGYIGAKLAVLPGAAVGFLTGIIKIMLK